MLPNMLNQRRKENNLINIMSKFLNITVCTLDTVVDVGGAFSTENSPVTMVIGFSHNVQHAQKKMLQ